MDNEIKGQTLTFFAKTVTGKQDLLRQIFASKNQDRDIGRLTPVLIITKILIEKKVIYTNIPLILNFISNFQKSLLVLCILFFNKFMCTFTELFVDTCNDNKIL